MNEIEIRTLVRENDYLKMRCSQLQRDLTDVGAQVLRLQTQLERIHSRRVVGRADLLAGGQ